MKKLIAMGMLVCTLMTVFAGCGKAPQEVPAETEAMNLPASPLEILETVWGLYAEDEKFAICGGNIESNIMGAPGAYDMTYAENLTYSLLVPEDQIANVAEAASMIHMMNSNTFTCGAFKLAEGVSLEDFCAAMETSIQNNQWLCGFPDKLLIQNVMDEYVVVTYGKEEPMSTFAAHMEEAYPAPAVTTVVDAIIE